MLPTDVVNVIMSFHANPQHQLVMHEFKELVHGRPWTAFSMLWMDWFGYHLGAEFKEHLGLGDVGISPPPVPDWYYQYTP